MHIIQGFTPTSIAEETVNFYTALDAILDNILNKDITIILGHFHSKIGSTHMNHHMR